MNERIGIQRQRNGRQHANPSWSVPAGAWTGADGAARVTEATRSGGRPLEATTRTAMERSFGHDFSQVRVHADGQAGEAAAAMDAAAFAVGADIFVHADRYAPNSRAGLRLLAHELTHVVQQDRYGAPTFEGGRTLSRRSDAAEREAEAAADRVAGGQAVAIQAAPSAPVALGLLDWVEDKASGAWDTASGAASAVGGAAEDAASAVGSAASAAYQGYERATDFHQLTNALDTGVDWVEKQAAAGNQKMAESAEGIPVLGQLAQASSFIGTETTDLAGGLIKGAGDVVGGLGNAFFHPIDAAAGMEGILEHNSTVPFMGSTLKAAHGLYDLAANGGGQYGSSLGELANHVFNPLQQMQDDTNYDSGLARGILTPGAKSWEDSWQRMKDNPLDTLGRAAANVAPMMMGAGEADLAEGGSAAGRLGGLSEGEIDAALGDMKAGQPYRVPVSATEAGIPPENMNPVSRWGRPGLQPGDWVMNGPPDWSNYLRSFKWDPNPTNMRTPFGAGEGYLAPPSWVSWPSGWGLDGWWKGLFGQRKYTPPPSAGT